MLCFKIILDTCIFRRSYFLLDPPQLIQVQTDLDVITNIELTTVYCKLLEVEKFYGCRMNCNLLENIHGCMVVLCGQTLLHSGIIAISLETFCGY